MWERNVSAEIVHIRKQNASQSVSNFLAIVMICSRVAASQAWSPREFLSTPPTPTHSHTHTSTHTRTMAGKLLCHRWT